ncbi:MAG: hypothetical protein ACKOCJ_03830 [Burkholderiaceae bacterium]
MTQPAPALDLAYALARHGSEDVLRLLAPLALKTMTRTRAVLQSADATPLERADALHKMRGNALEVGLMPLAESTRPLELALRGQTAAPLDTLSAHCLACMTDAEAALQPWLRPH